MADPQSIQELAEPVHVPGQPQQDHPGDGKPYVSPDLVSWYASWGLEVGGPTGRGAPSRSFILCSTHALSCRFKCPFPATDGPFKLCSLSLENLLASVLPWYRLV